MYGNYSQGYFYIDLFVGSPYQKTSVIVDTGRHI